MQHPNPETVTLKDILITEELSRRASRTPNLQAENQAMRMLIHRMTHDAASLMQTLVDTALEHEHNAHDRTYISRGTPLRSENGGVYAVLAVSYDISDRNQAILRVQDTGTGIAPEHLPHLFERFYQVRGTQARTHEGSGIGLALVHELVRLQGGTIEVSSTVGEGTCFTIALRFGTAHLPSDRLQDEGDRSPIRTLSLNVTQRYKLN